MQGYRNLIILLIACSVIVNSLGLFSPIFSSADAYIYAALAKNIYLSHDFSNLVLWGKPWLDKPHFPFWLESLSYFIFGVKAFAYMLPGYLFYLIGAIYTYKLSHHLFANKQLSLLSVLVYLTSMRLMLSATLDVRAEAFLLGEIMPACYYWLHYYKRNRFTYLFWGSVFTALALMTKGLFTIVTIWSGIFVLALYQQQWRQFLSFKWLYALILIFLLSLPELVALCFQFNGQAHQIIHSIKWFYWDSQFGRFFDVGPINRGHYSLTNFFFFFHTFLWAFLPWSIIFITALINIIKNFVHFKRIEKYSFVFLLGSFFSTFIMFSLTSFQLDYYINIIFPFSAIIVSYFLLKLYHANIKLTNTLQTLVNIILLLLIVLLPVLLSEQHLISRYFLFIPLATIILYFYAWRKTVASYKIIVASSLLINAVFILALIITACVHVKYDAGYQAARYINAHENLPVYSVNTTSESLYFYLHQPYHRIKNLSQLPSNENYYLLLQKPLMKPAALKKYYLIMKIKSISNKLFFVALFNAKVRTEKTHYVFLYRVQHH